MTKELTNQLIEAALLARQKSYAPYSSFSVGAALLCDDGSIYTGANIENAAHTPTVCAERTAFFTAIHNGARRFSAIAVVGGPTQKEIDSFCPPCGVCRQVMSEFCNGDFKILLCDGKQTKTLTLDQLLPERFVLRESEEQP